MADFTTTTEEDGERMINPTEQKLQRYWDRIQRALQVLQRAQRYLPKNSTEMERCTDGDYVDITDVRAAIDILQEGRQ